jgi:SulP family sulfate permease
LSIEAGLSTAGFVVPKNPLLSWIPMQITNRIHFDNPRGDIFGGITAAIVSLPLALAFGVASGAGAIAGLYGAVCVGFFAALFGGTPTLISEPTGPMTVGMTAVVASLTAQNPNYPLTLSCLKFCV